MKIADLFFGSHLDDTGLLKDVHTSGDKAGKELGSRMGTAASVALRGGLAAVAGGAAIALRGLQELDGITAKFAADTGATAEEAKRAGQAINEMAGRNLQPLSEIGDALTVVHTDLGLTGAAAEKTTEAFLKYATATGQNAASAVKSFDDILDAWNLTAADSQAVMDELIASHQKYGGSIEANQAALAKMAPQLKVLNASWQDGIGLLNLFAASGLDSEKALGALNTAVTKLKPGQSLNDLIREISAIEDPAKRAQKAIEVFGGKGGVALANALHPGITSLGDFEISASDAAGATQRASDVIEGTFSNRIKLAIKAVGAEIIGLGQDFGPALTGLAGLLAVAGSLGGGKLTAALAGGIKEAWTKAAASGVVRAAIARAGSAGATAYLAALITGDRIEAALKGAWATVANSSALKGATAKAGDAMGSTLGKAVSVAFAAVLVVEAIDTYNRIKGQLAGQGTAIGTAVGQEITTGTLDQLKTSQAALEGGLSNLSGILDFGLISGDAKANLTKQLEAINAEIARRTAEAAKYTRDNGREAGLAFTGGVGDGVEAGVPLLSQVVGGTIKDAFGSNIAASNSYSRAFGNRAGAAVAAGILEKRSAVDQSWQTFLDALKNTESPLKERAKLLGELASKELARGLRSGDPAVRAQAQATKQVILDRLAALNTQPANIGKKGMEELRKAMKSKDPDIRAAATAIYNAARHGKSGNNGPADVADGAKTWGENIDKGIVSGLRAKVNLVASAADAVAKAIGNRLTITSPAKEGPLSLAGGPEGWGHNLGSDMAKGVVGAVDAARAAATQLAAALVPASEIDRAYRGLIGAGPRGAGQARDAARSAVPVAISAFRPETLVPSVPGAILPFALPHGESAGGGTVVNVGGITVTAPTVHDTPAEIVRHLRFAARPRRNR